MKFFVDSAELEHIQAARSYGILDGVTTNPSLIKKAVLARQKAGEEVDLAAYIRELLSIAQDVPVSLEVGGGTSQEMIDQGRTLYSLFNAVAGNVWIKIPVDPSLPGDTDRHFEGIRAIRALAREGIPINCTLIFTPEQALLAANAGATAVSPFAGRVDDWLRTQNGLEFSKDDYFPALGLDQVQVRENQGLVSGVDLVRQCVDILRAGGFSTQVLAASLRNPRQVREAALAGAHIATLPFSVVTSMRGHEQSVQGMQSFTADLVPEYTALFGE